MGMRVASVTREQLERALASTTTVADAAQCTADHLVAGGFAMPSVYVPVAGRLRCLAQRGYWQVHDGVPPERGILGATYRAGQPSITPDVRLSPEFVPAGQGVVAEVAFPLLAHGRQVGVLNVESPRALVEGDVARIRAAAGALARRIEQLGGLPAESPWQRLALEVAAFPRLNHPGAVAERAAARAARLIGYSSALVVLAGTPPRAVAVDGPLSAVLRQLQPSTLAAIASWTGGGSSVYTFGEFPGTGFSGAEHIWDAGIEALVCVPLVGGDGPRGFLLVADDEPHTPPTEDVQILELYAMHVASALQATEAFTELSRQASRDVLTGLGHNAAFRSLLAAERERDDRNGLAVVLVDLDGFKGINDTSGHLTGDRVLVDVARALADAVRDADRVHRLGGDEFAVAVRVADAEEAARVGERLRVATARTGHTTASIGVVWRSPSAIRTSTADALIADADLALYEAKRCGRDRVELFRRELREVVLHRARMAAELAGAIARDELFLLFQPVVDLTSGRVLGAEALIRWNHRERGIVGPVDFIPVAEEDGQITAIGRWVLGRACAEAAAWNRRRAPGGLLKVGVNVAGQQLEPGFVDDVRAALDGSGLPPDALVLEITESALVDEAERIEVLRAVRALGAHVAVDDFGTGYSSLSYLRRLPIDVVKIDRSFVAELDDRRNAAVARAIVDLARTLELSCVAEGVETAEQAARLVLLGCEHAQGFLWCKPVPAAQLPLDVPIAAVRSSA